MNPQAPSSHAPSSGLTSGSLEAVETADPPVVDQAAAVLEDVTLLLHQAALASWEIGDREGVTSEFHYLGLGVYLAQGNAALLLPDDHVMSQSWPPVGPPAQNDPAALIASAETRLRDLDPTVVAGLSDLVLEVCDLVREFRDVARFTQLEDLHRHG